MSSSNPSDDRPTLTRHDKTIQSFVRESWQTIDSDSVQWSGRHCCPSHTGATGKISQQWCSATAIVYLSSLIDYTCRPTYSSQNYKPNCSLYTALLFNAHHLYCFYWQHSPQRYRQWWADIHWTIDWLSMVLRLRQHNIGYTADGFYRAMHFSAKRGIAIACRLSVCPSVCL